MNTGDVRIQDTLGLNTVPTVPWNTKAGSTALNPGEVVKADKSGNGAQYAVIVADGDGTTSQQILGVVKGGPSKSGGDSVTATADGQVDVYLAVPGVVFACKAKTSTNANTAAKILALLGKRVKFSVTSGAIGIDTAQADATTNGVLIVGGDYTTSTIYFIIRSAVSVFGNPTT